MRNNIFIPNKIRVGFQNRKDTYTQQLAYVIYYDQYSKLRKETSWEGWRDEKIEPVDFDNTPTSGFVLNKKVGGYSTGWNHRQTYVRIYDPRNFEFEITVPNLLYILENTNSIKGKGLEGEFVYGWDGKDLVLVPTLSPDYEEMTKFNEIVHNNDFIKAKDLIVGATYKSKNNNLYVYMGKFDCYDHQYRTMENGEYKWYKRYKDIPLVEAKNSWGCWGKRYMEHEYKQTNCGKEFFFLVKDDNSQEGYFTHMKSISKTFISVVDGNCTEEYANLFERLEHYEYYSPVDDSKDVITPYTFDEFNSVIKEHEDKGYHWYPRLHNKNGETFEVKLKDGKYKIGYNQNEPEMDLAELFSKINPVHLDKYLENNKLYQRSY